MKNIAIYPGCSLEGTAGSYLDSLQHVLTALGIELHQLKDWSCCGATSAHAVDHGMYLSLATRNLALAEAQGYEEVLAPCAACYHRLASANSEMKHDDKLRLQVNAKAGLNYGGKIKVRNVLDLLANVVGVNRIADRVLQPLANMKVACYYGCLNTRVPRMKSFDDAAYPMSMDRVVQALGANAIDWSYKTECCGASLFVSSEATAFRLVSKILKDAEARGADCICVACPMCHNNLDTSQKAIRKQFGIARPLPILFVSQLMGLAFGLDRKALRLDDSFVSAAALEEVSAP
jgi:heterodisulfide reductase subunit B2